MSSSSITFRGSNGSLTTSPRKLINFGGSRKKQEAVAKKITSTIAKHTKLPEASAKRVASTPSKFPLYTITSADAADCDDTDALCSTLLHDSTSLEMLLFKNIFGVPDLRSLHARCCCRSLPASCATAPCLCGLPGRCASSASRASASTPTATSANGLRRRPSSRVPRFLEALRRLL